MECSPQDPKIDAHSLCEVVDSQTLSGSSSSQSIRKCRIFGYVFRSGEPTEEEVEDLLSGSVEVGLGHATVGVALMFSEFAKEVLEKLRSVLSHSLEELMPKRIGHTALLHRGTGRTLTS